jgi:helix-turn-helix domain-containing protein|nr:MAG TPA: repressor protein [Siphoviridae sp. ctuK76]DAO25304.1 MAG TPA: repressor protein [Caudoviricetes sp.]
MTTVDKVRDICKTRKIPVSRLERDLGFSNGYINQLRKGTFPSDRLVLISNYLDVSVSELLGDNEMSDTLSEHDKRDISKSLNEMMAQLENGDDSPLMYNGQELSDTSKALLKNALEYALTETKKENKVKYNPHKGE